jgi:hypothetical protein
LIRDLYNGALADLDLGLSPWTMNRYGFAGGNPISFIELDGHIGGLPDEDLRELRKAGYTYVMDKGVVPLPGGASGGISKGLAPPPVVLPLPPGRVPPIAGGRGGLGVLGLVLGILSLSGDTPRRQKLDVDPEERQEACLSQSSGTPSWWNYWNYDSERRATGAEGCFGPDAPRPSTNRPRYTPPPGDSRPRRGTWIVPTSSPTLSVAPISLEHRVLHQTRNRSDMKKLENEARNRIASGQRVYYLAISQYDFSQIVPIGISVYMASRSSNPAVPSSPVVDTWVPNTGR